MKYSKSIILFLILSLAFISACTQQQENSQQPQSPPAETLTTESANSQAITLQATKASQESAKPSTATAQAVKEINIEAFNWGFDIDNVAIKKGDKVKLRIKSREGTHGFRMPGFSISTSEIKQGQEQVVEFTAEKAGSFDYFCNVPCGKGHKEMKGTLVIGE